MAVPTIKNVAIAGAAGRLGKVAAPALIAAGFNVTALVRPGSKSTLPAGVKSVETDFSHESLVKALHGQDALISVIPGGNDEQLLAPAIEAGVYRLIPSQFASSLHNNPGLREFKLWKDKWAFQEKADAEAKKNPKFTWTSVENGLFAEFVFILLGKPHVSGKATIVDGGDHALSVTSLSDISKALVGIMQHPVETANRAVSIHTGYTTPNAVLKTFREKHPETKFEVQDRSSDDVQTSIDAELKKENPSFFIWAVGQIWIAASSAKYDGVFDKVDNELFGIKQLTEKEMTDYVVEQYNYQA